jgi:hypothetical protein
LTAAAFSGGNPEEPVLFHRKQPRNQGERQLDQAGLVETLLEADERERKRVLLVALQSGDLRKSEVPDLLRLVQRLEAFSDTAGDTGPGH